MIHTIIRTFITRHIIAPDPNPGYSDWDKKDGLR